MAAASSSTPALQPTHTLMVTFKSNVCTSLGQTFYWALISKAFVFKEFIAAQI